MERAAASLVRHFTNEYTNENHVHIFCGQGNNGGDGLAMARMLSNHGYKADVYLLLYSDNKSEDFEANLDRLGETDVNIHRIYTKTDLPENPLNGIIVDAIFGSGLNRALKDLPAHVVNYINEQECIVISIDIPTGVFADKPVEDPAVMAHMVYTFQFPKLAFFMPNNGIYIQKWKVLDIGLDSDAIEAVDTVFVYNTLQDMRCIYKKRSRFSHKGSHGHVLLIAGSEGKAGAAILAARATLRSGIGLLTMHLPKNLVIILQIAVPEAMCQADKSTSVLSNAPSLENYNAIGIGPGLGQHEETCDMMTDFLKRCKMPVVLDADGLNILALKKELWDDMPEGSILTPHPGEFKRLAGAWKNDFDKLKKQIDISKQRKVVIVLKGAHTSISTPDGMLYFNSTGNHGMATAGSGDSLTGLITGLLAQGYTSVEAARLAVFIHGLAGDLALGNQHPNSLIASDIISQFGHAFQHINRGI